ncbi:MAG: oxidoreductase [Rhodobacterales bacterium 32-67-9]|nr:MAG: oxidoreductase [Rhodobacterales bacterium 32-67-9]
MTVRIAVVGAGLIGARHAEAIAAAPDAALASVTDPSEVGQKVATAQGVRHFTTLAKMLAEDRPDGVILATPNQAHVEGALDCIAAGMPVLVEKPLATDLDGAGRIVAAASAAGVSVAVGHHRRHNPLIARAKAEIAAGRIGRIIAVQGTTWFLKPEEYFDVEWRRKPGAGPVYLNLIHDIDLLRHLCGEIASVHAMESNAVRGNEVEETAVILVRFESGALGTVSVSDTVVAPWSWELTARENAAYPATGENCYWIGGTEGSLALPNLSLWSNPGKRSWWEPISATRLPFGLDDPLVRQVRQFVAVIRGEEAPLVPVEEGMRNLRVIEAVKRSAASGATVELG